MKQYEYIIRFEIGSPITVMENNITNAFFIATAEKIKKSEESTVKEILNKTTGQKFEPVGFEYADFNLIK